MVNTSHTIYPNTFGGIDGEIPEEKTKAVILPIPLEKTTTYERGTERGPQSILKASLNMELYDEETGSEPYKAGIYTDLSLMNSNFSLIDLNTSINLIEETVLGLLKRDKFVVSLGGEHSITIGIVKAFRRHFKNGFTVVQFDAHADLRESYEGNKNSHACVMRRVIEKNSIVQLGIRSISIEEAKFIKARKLKVHFAGRKFDSKFAQEICKEIKTKDIYITFDLDFLDPSCMPAVGTPEPGGYGYDDALFMLKSLVKEKNLIGIDFNELLPIKGMVFPDFLTSKLVYKILAYKYFLKNK